MHRVRPHRSDTCGDFITIPTNITSTQHTNIHTNKRTHITQARIRNIHIIPDIKYRCNFIDFVDSLISLYSTKIKLYTTIRLNMTHILRNYIANRQL